jgi:hypothetical protein
LFVILLHGAGIQLNTVRNAIAVACQVTASCQMATVVGDAVLLSLLTPLVCQVKVQLSPCPIQPLLHLSATKGRTCYGQNSWIQIQRSQVQFPPVPDFLRSRGYIQPRLETEINGRDTDRATPFYPQKFELKFADQRRSLSPHGSLAE